MKKAIHVCQDWWALNLFNQSSFLKSRASRGQWKDKKTLKYKRTSCSFLQIAGGSYIFTNITDKNMRNINSSICLFSYMAFFPALPYTPHKTTSHFVEVCFFRFFQTAVFVLPFSVLPFITNWTQTFINAYKFHFVLVHNVYIAPKNVELVPVLSSVFCYFVRLLENRA